MSMYPHEIGAIPAETVRVARAAYPKGSLAMRLRDELGGIYRDEHFVALFPSRGQPAEAPWRLALVLVLQYVDGLTDRQAADAVRGRIDWKYALGLELTDPGMDASVLSEFRARVVAGGAHGLRNEVAPWPTNCATRFLKSSSFDLATKAEEHRTQSTFEEVKTAGESTKRAAGAKNREKVWKSGHEAPLGEMRLSEERMILSPTHQCYTWVDRPRKVAKLAGTPNRVIVICPTVEAQALRASRSSHGSR